MHTIVSFLQFKFGLPVLAMDQPDNTENNLNISLDSEYFLDKQVNPAENDIIAELFQTHLKDTGVINVSICFNYLVYVIDSKFTYFSVNI